MDLDLSQYGLKPLGRIVGETTHSNIFFTASRPPKVGEYVIIDYSSSPMTVEGLESKYVLAIVESSIIGNPALSSTRLRTEYVDRASMFELERIEYNMGFARLLGWIEPLIEKKSLITPKYPPKPGTQVYEASPEVLNKIFFRDYKDGWIRIGVLVNHPKVPVYVNVNSIVSRHLAVLAVTGAGKSNTVGVLVDEIVNKLGGTVLVIDMHNEYSKIAGEKATREVDPKIHPVKLTIYEWYQLLSLDPKASKQRLYLRKAIRELRKEGLDKREPDKFYDNLIDRIEKYLREYKEDSKSIADLKNKLDELQERYGGRVLSADAPTSIEAAIEPGKANIFKLGSMSEDVADVVTYHYLNWLLSERKDYVMTRGKKGYPVPVLVVVEEAHILIPQKRSTLTKEAASRIAREGRKFGIGLCLVSQRPKNIDEDALSQTNNKIILKLVEPSDQRYVQRATETLSEELLQLLPSLNTGEAVILGMMTPLPALVKIDKARHKTGGTDIRAHEEWVTWKTSTSREGDEYDPYNMMEF